MITPKENELFHQVLDCVDPASDCAIGNTEIEECREIIDRETDKYAPNQGTDVIADGPDISTCQMLDEAARALGWRTDWACGDSPITWELVIEEVRKLKRESNESSKPNE